MIFNLFFTSLCFPQDLEKIGKKDMLTVHGGVNASSVLNQTNGIPQRRQPFTWMLSGNVTGNFLGISLPFVFNYSNNQVNYTQSYTIKSFNPSYKWFKGYAGTTSMNFSPYTVSGHVFNGGGIELNPKCFRFSALFGQFRKAVEYDVLNESDLNMSYRRMGGGALIGYEKGAQSLKLIFFSAKDDIRSLRYIPVNTEIKPMRNSVFSLCGKTLLFKIISIETEYALSSLDRNLYNSDLFNAVQTNYLPSFFSRGANSSLFSALKSSVAYRIKSFGIAFNYEKVDPGYQTLGAYYFNNDLVNYSLAPSLTLLNGKLSLSANAGLQKNNLDKEKLNTTSRFVAAGNIMYSPNKNWNLMASYSNFNSFTRQRPLSDPFYTASIDTLRFYQISQSSMASASYRFGTARFKQNVLVSGNFQRSGQTHGLISDKGFYNPVADIQTPDKNLSANASYNISSVQRKWNLSLLGNFNESFFGEQTLLFYGPGINMGKPFYRNKIKVSAGSTFNLSQSNGFVSGKVISNRLNASATLLSDPKTGNLSFSTSMSMVQRFALNAANSFTEFNCNLSLNYNF